MVNVGFGDAVVTLVVAWQTFHSSMPFFSSGVERVLRNLASHSLVPRRCFVGADGFKRKKTTEQQCFVEEVLTVAFQFLCVVRKLAL